MKWIIGLVFFLALLSLNSRLDAQSTARCPVIAVEKAPIIAFWPPQSKAGAAKDGYNEALDDFQFYAQEIKQPLEKMNVSFEALYVRSFRVRLDGKITKFDPKGSVGYYLIAPGKKPYVEYGVMTGADLLDLAKNYFGPPSLHQDR